MLPLIGSAEFKNLSFQEQIAIVRASMDGLDSLKHELSWLDTAVQELVLLGATEPPDVDDSFPHVVIQQWAAYSCSVNEYEKFLLAKKHGISHHRVITTHTFNFPILVVDRITRYLIEFFFDWSVFGTTSNFLLTIFKLRAWLDLEGHADEVRMLIRSSEDTVVRKLRRTVKKFLEEAKRAFFFITNIVSLNEHYPILDEEDSLLEMIVKDQVGLVPRCRIRGNLTFYPLIPTLLYNNQYFTVRDWDLLY